MVKLNLLPAKVRSAELLRLAALGGIVVYMIALSMLGWRFMLAERALGKVNEKIRGVEAELKPLQAIADEVRKLTEEKNEQDIKRAKLGELAKRQAYLVRMMDAIPDLMQNGQVWLSAIDQSGAGAGRRVGMEGKAVSIEAWADFYNNLESQSLISDIKIEAAPALEKDLARTDYRFKVSFVLKDAQ